MFVLFLRLQSYQIVKTKQLLSALFANIFNRCLLRNAPDFIVRLEM